MADHRNPDIGVLVILASLILPAIPIFVYLVWPPKRRLTTFAMRAIAVVIALAWPVAGAYPATFRPGDPKSLLPAAVMLAGAMPLVFVGIRTARMFPKTFAWLGKHPPAMLAFVALTLAIYLGPAKLVQMHYGTTWHAAER